MQAGSDNDFQIRLFEEEKTILLISLIVSFL